jgi:hypothetical protein
VGKVSDRVIKGSDNPTISKQGRLMQARVCRVGGTGYYDIEYKNDILYNGCCQSQRRLPIVRPYRQDKVFEMLNMDRSRQPVTAH